MKYTKKIFNARSKQLIADAYFKTSLGGNKEFLDITFEKLEILMNENKRNVVYLKHIRPPKNCILMELTDLENLFRLNSHFMKYSEQINGLFILKKESEKYFILLRKGFEFETISPKKWVTLW